MDLMQRLQNIERIAKQFEIPGITQNCAKLKEYYEYDKRHIVIIGEFNRGKSTFANALIGQNLLPMDIIPTTAKVWHIEQGDELRGVAVKKNGERVQLQLQGDFLSQFNADGKMCADDVRFIELTVPEMILGESNILIDTPGVNDINEQRAEITYKFLQMADAAVFLLDASSPLTRSEADFLQGQVLAQHLKKILFVLNKLDRVDEEEWEDAAESARTRLKTLLGYEPMMVMCDASRILSAILARDPEQSEKWGFNGIREAIFKMMDSDNFAKDKAQVVEGRISNLEAYLKDQLVAHCNFLELDSNNREHVLANIEKQLEEAELDMVSLKKYVQTFGRDQLKAMLSQSMKHYREEFIDAQKSKILNMTGDLKRYATEIFPHELQMSVKHWFESKSRVIQKYLGEFTATVSQQFQKRFGNPLLVACKDIEAPVGSTEVRSKVSVQDSPSEVITMGLPAAAYLLTSFLIGGPFGLLGLYAGKFLSSKLRNKELEQLRPIILHEVSGCVIQVSDDFLKNILGNVDSWFESFLAVLDEKYTEMKMRQMQLVKESWIRDQQKVAQQAAELRTVIGEMAINREGRV